MSCDQIQLPNLICPQVGAGCDPDMPNIGINTACNGTVTPAELAWANRYKQVGGGDKRQPTLNMAEGVLKRILEAKNKTQLKRVMTKYMTGSVMKLVEKDLVGFMEAVPNKEVEYGVFSTEPGTAKIFVVAKGRVLKRFKGMKPGIRREDIGIVSDISVKGQKIIGMRLKFEKLSRDKLNELRRMQRSVFVRAKQTGGGYYLELDNVAGKVPLVGTYLNCCPPIFTGPLLSGGGVLNELLEPVTGILAPNLYALQGVREGIANFTGKRMKKQRGGSLVMNQAREMCGDVVLREFGCTQPDWGV